ncbi:MAG: hypothetical protein FJ041_00205 [Candidatus Cloacimonetes bacterium]|nr:hypothetical protein [Candidatus Cloacimonadota bacterium]
MKLIFILLLFLAAHLVLGTSSLITVLAQQPSNQSGDARGAVDAVIKETKNNITYNMNGLCEITVLDTGHFANGRML